MEKQWISQSAIEYGDLLLNVKDRKTSIFSNVTEKDVTAIRNMTYAAMLGPSNVSIETSVTFGEEINNG